MSVFSPGLSAPGGKDGHLYFSVFPIASWMLFRKELLKKDVLNVYVKGSMQELLTMLVITQVFLSEWNDQILSLPWLTHIFNVTYTYEILLEIARQK